jgi:hypothetical protein
VFSRHSVDDDFLKLRQLRRPLVQGRVAGGAFRSLVQLKDSVHLKKEFLVEKKEHNDDILSFT